MHYCNIYVSPIYKSPNNILIYTNTHNNLFCLHIQIKKNICQIRLSLETQSKIEVLPPIFGVKISELEKYLNKSLTLHQEEGYATKVLTKCLMCTFFHFYLINGTITHLVSWYLVSFTSCFPYTTL